MTTSTALIEALLTRPSVTAEEAAHMYSVSTVSIYRRIAAGDLKAIKHGRRFSIPTGQIREELGIPAPWDTPAH